LTRFKERVCSTIEDVGVGGVSYNDIEEIGWGFRIASLYILFYLFMLIFFITSNTIALSQNKYLSLSGDDDTQICSEIPQTLTATFEGSYQGYWNTNPNFNINSSLYVLKLSGASLNNEEYYQIMSSFQDNMQAIGTKASNRSALWSLIVWSTFTYTAKDSSVVFYSNADAGVIFNLKSYAATLSSRDGTCPNKFLSGSFDVASKRLSITFPLNDTALSDFLYDYEDGVLKYLEPCPKQGNFSESGFLNLGWMNDRSGFFDLSFDVRSAVIAVALNLNLLNASTLVKTTTQASADFHSYLYIDPDYSPPMSPIICLDKVDKYWNLTQQQINGPEICFVYQGADNNLFFAYPIMINLNETLTGACNCPQGAEDYNCNIADYVIGFIYDLNFNFTTLVETLATKMQDIMIKDPDNGDVTVMNTLAPILTNTIYSPGNLNNTYDTICSSCGTAVLELYGYDGYQSYYYNQLIMAMNQNGVQLSQLSSKIVVYTYCEHYNYTDYNCTKTSTTSQPQFMCTDSFSQPLALSNLASSPPVPLVQNYFECRLRTTSAFQQAIGIGSGSASLYTSIFVAVFGFLFIKYMKYVKKIKLHNKRTMDKKKELYEEKLSRIHKKEMAILKSMIVELSEASMMQSNGATKDKLSKSLFELKNLSYTDDNVITISDDRVSRLDSDINPLYTNQKMTVRNTRMDDNVITISDDRVSRQESDINPMYTDQEMTVRNTRMDGSVINPLSVDKDVPC